MDHIKQVLSVSGYAKWAWDLPGSKKSATHTPARASNPPKGHITLPYIAGVTESIARKIRKSGVMVHSKPTNTLHSQLVAPKDKLDKMDKCGAVYRIQCNKCPDHYIGETARPLRKRAAEHKRESSPVGAHMHSKRHCFGEQNIEVLDQDSRWLQRGIREAIHIAANKPTLNRDQGRHLLPSAYNSLIQSCKAGINPSHA